MIFLFCIVCTVLYWHKKHLIYCPFSLCHPYFSLFRMMAAVQVCLWIYAVLFSWPWGVQFILCTIVCTHAHTNTYIKSLFNFWRQLSALKSLWQVHVVWLLLSFLQSLRHWISLNVCMCACKRGRERDTGRNVVCENWKVCGQLPWKHCNHLSHNCWSSELFLWVIWLHVAAYIIQCATAWYKNSHNQLL